MAHYSTYNTAFGPASNPISGIFTKIANALVMISSSNDRLRQVEALQSLSDEQLKTRGVRREDIARYVFRDVIWY